MAGLDRATTRLGRKESAQAKVSLLLFDLAERQAGRTITGERVQYG